MLLDHVQIDDSVETLGREVSSCCAALLNSLSALQPEEAEASLSTLAKSALSGDDARRPGLALGQFLRALDRCVEADRFRGSVRENGAFEAEGVPNRVDAGEELDGAAEEHRKWVARCLTALCACPDVRTLIMVRYAGITSWAARWLRHSRTVGPSGLEHPSARCSLLLRQLVLESSPGPITRSIGAALGRSGPSAVRCLVRSIIDGAGSGADRAAEGGGTYPPVADETQLGRSVMMTAAGDDEGDSDGGGGYGGYSGLDGGYGYGDGYGDGDKGGDGDGDGDASRRRFEGGTPSRRRGRRARHRLATTRPEAALCALSAVVRGDAEIQAFVRSLPDNAALLRSLIGSLSSPRASVVVWALGALLHLSRDSPLFARLFDAANAREALALAFGIVASGGDDDAGSVSAQGAPALPEARRNDDLVRVALALITDMACAPVLRDHVAAYDGLAGGLRAIAQLLPSSDLDPPRACEAHAMRCLASLAAHTAIEATVWSVLDGDGGGGGDGDVRADGSRSQPRHPSATPGAPLMMSPAPALGSRLPAGFDDDDGLDAGDMSRDWNDFRPSRHAGGLGPRAGEDRFSDTGSSRRRSSASTASSAAGENISQIHTNNNNNNNNNKDRGVHAGTAGFDAEPAILTLVRLSWYAGPDPSERERAFCAGKLVAPLLALSARRASRVLSLSPNQRRILVARGVEGGPASRVLAACVHAGSRGDPRGSAADPGRAQSFKSSGPAASRRQRGGDLGEALLGGVRPSTLVSAALSLCEGRVASAAPRESAWDPCAPACACLLVACRASTAGDADGSVSRAHAALRSRAVVSCLADAAGGSDRFGVIAATGALSRCPGDVQSAVASEVACRVARRDSRGRSSQHPVSAFARSREGVSGAAAGDVSSSRDGSAASSGDTGHTRFSSDARWKRTARALEEKLAESERARSAAEEALAVSRESYQLALDRAEARNGALEARVGEARATIQALESRAADEGPTAQRLEDTYRKLILVVDAYNNLEARYAHDVAVGTRDEDSERRVREAEERAVAAERRAAEERDAAQSARQEIASLSERLKTALGAESRAKKLSDRLRSVMDEIDVDAGVVAGTPMWDD